MFLRKGRGFIIIIVVALTALVMLIAWAIVNIGLGEILQARVRNDFQSAFYVASAGAEYMYASLKASSVVLWGHTVTGALTVIDHGATLTIGSFSATANTISSDEFCIVSTGIVNGRSETVIVKYGFSADFTGGVPLGSIGDMALTGASTPAKLMIEGPVKSMGTLTETGDVRIANTGEMPDITAPDFWETPDPNDPTNLRNTPFDTNDDGYYNYDLNDDKIVTRAEAMAQENSTRLAAIGQDSVQVFNNDNKYHPDDDEISDKDAFYYYYTGYLNDAANNRLGVSLNIGEGQAYHYNGDMSFTKNSIPNSVPIIFIDGNVTSIDQNDQNWQSSGILSHTIVIMGNLGDTEARSGGLIQPTNRPGDVLTVVTYGNTYMTGEMGNQGGTIGDIIIYTNGNLVADNGGKINASILVKGDLTIDTIGDDQGKDHRILNASTIDWTNPNARPLGLPPGYGVISSTFVIDNESTYKSIWQRK